MCAVRHNVYCVLFTMLVQTKPTATGLVKLPASFINTAAPFFCKPLTYLFNLSMSQSKVPSQWKISCITPVPKVRKLQLSRLSSHLNYLGVI